MYKKGKITYYEFFHNFQVILTLSVAGAMRRSEVYNLMPNNVIYITELDEIDVKITDSKNHTSRSFRVVKSDSVNYIKCIRKYMDLADAVTNRKAFLMTYANGKCVSNRMGINKISNCCKTVATFLGLSDPGQYTSHWCHPNGEFGGIYDATEKIGRMEIC